MRPFALVLLGLTSSVAAGAQSRAAEILRRISDSSAVVQVIERFHQALATDDTATVFRVLAASAVYIDKDEVLTVADLRGDRMAGKGRWERVIERRKGPIHVRVSGDMAWAYWVWRIQARAQPELISGSEAETIVLTRVGTTWLIAAIHNSVGSS